MNDVQPARSNPSSELEAQRASSTPCQTQRRATRLLAHQTGTCSVSARCLKTQTYMHACICTASHLPHREDTTSELQAYLRGSLPNRTSEIVISTYEHASCTGTTGLSSSSPAVRRFSSRLGWREDFARKDGKKRVAQDALGGVR
jgi:hypothetical protein